MEECAFLDIREPTKSQLAGLRYVSKILSSHNTTIDNVTIDKLLYIIQNYKVLITNNGLSPGSIKYILSVMYKYRPELKETDEAKKFSSIFKRNQVFDNNNMLSGNEEIAIKASILYFTNLFVTNINDNALYYTSLAIQLVLCTNLRSSEIQQLTMYHLQQLVKNQTIAIRIKKKLKPIHIISNQEMLKATIAILSERVVNIHELLLKVSKVCINATFKAHTDLPKSSRIGIQAIRKINTTILIKHGSLELASVFNRHTSKEMTDKYYNTKSYVEPFINNIYMNILTDTLS